LSLDEIVLCPATFVESAGVVGRGRVNVRIVLVVVLLFIGVEVIPARPRRATTGSTVWGVRFNVLVITLIAFVLAVITLFFVIATSIHRRLGRGRYPIGKTSVIGPVPYLCAVL